MADLTLATANKITVLNSGPSVVITGVAGEDITAGAPVFYDATTAKWKNSDANDSNTGYGLFGVALESVYAGAALTVGRFILLIGWSNLPVPGSIVYVSNTVGALADAAGSTSIKVGVVVAIFGTTLGTAPDRALLVQPSL
jgi:hypothetical protein